MELSEGPSGSKNTAEKEICGLQWALVYMRHRGNRHLLLNVFTVYVYMRGHAHTQCMHTLYFLVSGRVSGKLCCRCLNVFISFVRIKGDEQRIDSTTNYSFEKENEQ